MNTDVLYLTLIFYLNSYIKCIYGSECAVGTEGSSIRLLCKVTSAVNRLITWQVDKGDGYVDMTTCHMNGVCTTNSPAFYSFLTGTNCTIHMRSLNRNLSSWRCVWDDEHYGPPCNITVYVPPKKPTCDPPKFVNSNTVVSVTCRTEKTYPVAQCFFTQYTHTGALNNSRIVHKNLPSPISSHDFSTECTIVSELLPVNPPVTLILGIKMISLPNTAPVSGENISLELYYPVPDLDLECPRDYIMSGSTASCTCKLSNLGSPPGQTHWISSNIDKVLSFPKTNGSSQLDFSFNSSVLDPVYYCYAISSIGQPFNTIIYEPKFAFGPSQVYLEAMTSPTIHFTSPVSVLLRCNVSKDQVRPGVVFHFDSTNKNFSNWPYHSDGHYYTSSLIYTPESPGMFNVTCSVHNAKFASIRAQNTLTIQAYVPPKKPTCDPPQFVNSNTAVSVTCRTEKTFPVAQCFFPQYTHTGALNNSRIVHKNFRSPISSHDFSTECTFVSDLLPVNPPVTLILGIKMISLPNTAPVSGENISVDLYYPVPDLDLECPRDYIMSGSTASCTCKLSNLGSPPGKTHWISSNIDKVLSFPKTNGSSQLDFSFNSSVPDPVYYCYAISFIGQAFNTIIYEPKFAFGPSQVYLEAMTSPTIHFTRTASVLLRCNVSKDQVLPGVVFHFDSTNKNFPNWPYHSDGRFYTSSLIYTPESPGMFNVTCSVHNAKFASISAQYTLTLQAYGGSAHIKLDIPGLLDVDLCSRSTIAMSCKVAVNQAYPATTSYLYFNNKVYLTRTSYDSDAVHNLNFNFLPSTPGRFEVRCRVQNNYTSALLAEEVNVITVSGGTCGLNTLTLGLTVGLGCSLLALLIVIVLFALWRRRQSKLKEQEKKAVYFTVSGSKVNFVLKDDKLGSNKLVSEPPPDYAEYDKPTFIPRVSARQKQALRMDNPAYTASSSASRMSLSQKSNAMETESHIYSTVDG